MQRTIHLAGGCFWGLEHLYSVLPGVVSATSGYANSQVPDPTYRQVCTGTTGATEAVEVVYDPQLIALEDLLLWFFEVVDTSQKNRQGNDIGTQYRNGIYWSDPADEKIVRDFVKQRAERSEAPIVTELMPLQNFTPAEEYHQQYLDKNPGGYCHIPSSAIDRARQWVPDSGHVIREAGTERPFTGRFDDHDERGIYVDIVTGEPLFSSADKFDAGCGWPAFAKPLAKDEVVEKLDHSHGMMRMEVRTSGSDAHLGHVFTDGPEERGGLRYCINSAALAFIPESRMAAAGYGAYLDRL